MLLVLALTTRENRCVSHFGYELLHAEKCAQLTVTISFLEQLELEGSLQRADSVVVVMARSLSVRLFA